MHVDPFTGEQFVVERFLQQCVAERVLTFAARLDELVLGRFPQELAELDVVVVGDLGEQVVMDRASRRGRDAQQLLRRVGQHLDAHDQDIAQRR